MGYLSEELKRFYRKSGNKLLFKETMSLNELAFEMWEKLEYTSIDPSVLSKIVKGEKIFSSRQLNAFSTVLRLSRQDKFRLQNSTVLDLIEQKGFGTKNEKYFLRQKEFFLYLVSCLENLRISGNIQTVFELSHFILASIQDIPQSFLNDKYTKQTIGTIYAEQSRTYAEISADSSTRKRMKKMNGLSHSIALNLHNVKLLERSYVLEGGYFYLEGKWKESSDFFESKYKNVSKPIQMEFLRTLLINYSKLKDFYMFKRAFSKAYRLVERYIGIQNDSSISLLESMARSLLSFNLLKESKDILHITDTLQKSPFHEAQLIRCRAYLLQHQAKSFGTLDKQEFISITSTIMNKKFSEYKRHKNQIMSIGKNLGVIQ